MSMKQVRDHYRVPAKRGMRIVFQGRPCTITASDTSTLRLRVRFDDEPEHTHRIHPTWEVEYPVEPAKERRSRVARPRVYHQGPSIYVIGTDDTRTACRAAGISPETHSWARTGYGLYARRKNGWQDVDEFHPPKDARPGVVFVGPIYKRETPL